MSTPPLDPARWQHLSVLFEQAIELDADAREAFIAAHCAGQPGMELQLRAMLVGDEDGDALIDAPLSSLVSSDSLGPDPSDASGIRLGPYQIDRVLGSGGMGTVYLAHRQDDFSQQVAIKRLRQRWDGQLQAERFLQERQILANLSHPYIARLLDGGIDVDGQPWFAMEYVEGLAITAWADARQLDLHHRIVLLGKVCEAVQHAHERLVVHRDLKPDNLLVDANGHPKVLDFGVAKLMDPVAGSATRTGVLAGFTPEYATPEQISGRPVTAATDVYALGLLLYQLLTGRLPYDLPEHDLPARVRAISQDAPMRPEQALTTGQADEVQHRLHARRTDAHAFRRFVGGDLTRILQTALAKEPERRYATVQAFADDLQRFLDGRPVSVTGDTFGYRARKFIGRNRWGVAMGALASLALITGVVGVVMQTREARAQAARATAEAARAEIAAKRANTSRDFLIEMLGQASPEESPLDSADVTIREFLDGAVPRIEERLPDEPLLQAELLSAIAEVYNSLNLYDQSGPLLHRAIVLSEGVDPVIEANARLALAGPLLSKDRAALRTELQRVAVLEPTLPLELRSDYAFIAAALENVEGNPTLSREHARRGIALVQQAHGEDSERWATIAIELSYLLEAPESLGYARKALAYYEKKANGTDSAELTRALWALGNAAHESGQPRESLQALQRALPMVGRIYGEDSPKYARALQLTALPGMVIGPLPEYEAMATRARDLYSAATPGHPLVSLLTIMQADASRRQGHADQALLLLAPLLADAKLRPSFRERAGMIRLHALVQVHGAEVARQQLQADLAQGVAYPAQALALIRAAIAREEGDADAARNALSVSEQEDWAVALEQARIEATAGQPDARRAAAARALAGLQALGVQDTPELHEARRLAE